MRLRAELSRCPAFLSFAKAEYSRVTIRTPTLLFGACFGFGVFLISGQEQRLAAAATLQHRNEMAGTRLLVFRPENALRLPVL
jgi:hypothetical protein